MTEDIRWKQRIENFGMALSRFKEALVGIELEPLNHLYQIALIGAFQFTFELSWKTIKDFLSYNGIEVSLPREVIKQAFHHQIIQNGQIWIDMLEDRNLMAHVYQEKAAIEASKNIREAYASEIEQLYNYLFKKL